MSKFICLLFPVSFLLLTGCANDGYYAALAEQYKGMCEDARLEREFRQKALETPLVSHTWTDTDGNQHSITVNQPYIQQQSETEQKQFHVPAPWEGAYMFYNRTLGSVEKYVPLLDLFTDGSQHNNNTTYDFAGDGYVLEVSGSQSSIDFNKDVTEYMDTGEE